MSELDLARVREAWRNASPGDVVRGLKNSDDYPSAVVAIIREEARRRGLNASSDEAFTPWTVEFPRRVVSFVGPFVAPICRRAQSHAFVSGMVLGVLCALCGMFLSWLRGRGGGWIQPGVFPALYVGGLLVICWPLRSYRAVVIAPLSAWLGITAASTVFVYIAFRGSPQIQVPVKELLSGLLKNLLVLYGGPCALLGALVFVRNRYWPVYEPGRCRVCDYDLRGLPEPRCPECGTPFDPDEAPKLNAVGDQLVSS